MLLSARKGVKLEIEWLRSETEGIHEVGSNLF
jgi:hypothetical protein